jgi:predicted RNA-binding protein YlxR (DUF448 family)
MIYVTNTVDGRVRVNGRKLKINEYPDTEFFSYRAGRGYFVCETQTGLAFAWGKKLKLAKKEAIKRMDSMAYKELKRLIKAKLERYGRIN